MPMNGHFASLGDHSDKTAYDNGVQVVDESKEFKYDSPNLSAALCNSRIASLFNAYQSFV